MPGPNLDITVADLEALGHLLPATAVALVHDLGAEIAVALMNRAAGAELHVPKANDASPREGGRWERLAAIVGEPAMPQVVAARRGDVIEVPRCLGLRREKTARWIRSRFDDLTTGPCALSGKQAVYELGRELAAAGSGMTHRVIERALGAADAGAGPSRPPLVMRPPLPLFPDLA